MQCEQCETELGENPLSHKCNANGAEYVLCNKHYADHKEDYHGGFTQPNRKPYFTPKQLESVKKQKLTIESKKLKTNE